MGNLKQLQILENVDIKRISRKAIKELGELTQLRKLAVTGVGASKKKCKAFCEAAEKLSSLRSLNVSSRELNKEAELDMFVSWTSPLPSLLSLKLKGRLQEIPSWVAKSVNLVKIELKYCGLKELEALAELPNLMQVRIYGDAYNEKLVFHKHAFSKLRILHLELHHALREVTFEESASPNMESITILYCKLTSGINGIKYLPKLREINVRHCRLAKQDMLQEEAGKHPNHPVLQMVNCDPANTEQSAELPTRAKQQAQIPLRLGPYLSRSSRCWTTFSPAMPDSGDRAGARPVGPTPSPHRNVLRVS
ncbi:disease resistance protein RPM1-like [Phragmites australis]|uniref:disease resistance protein RPM1-like n=1 Tax=Phragmites australis TaxID=29695 RepID=UPI002D7746FA|nr:disease resistance protein RPM1-like [Phragmites australis]